MELISYHFVTVGIEQLAVQHRRHFYTLWPDFTDVATLVSEGVDQAAQ